MPMLNLPDADLYYEVHGSGPALMFLAATAWPGSFWKLHQVSEFSRDRQVIIMDQRGTGRSTTRSKDFSTQALASDVLALLDHLGVEKASLCGHSNGGRIALQIAIEHPERVDRLVMLSGGATHTHKGLSVGLCLSLVENGYEGHIRRSMLRTGVTKAFYAANTDKVDEFIALFLSDLAPLASYLGHVMGRTESDTTAGLGKINAPTLVLIGDDEATPGNSGDNHMEAAELLAREIQNAKLVTMPNSGHYYPFFAPELTNKTIREFLDS